MHLRIKAAYVFPALPLLAIVAAGLFLPQASAMTAPVILYDGALGGTPHAANQNMVYQPVGFNIIENYDNVSASTVLSTTALKANQAGYSPDYNKPAIQSAVVLDRSKGYVVKFTVRVNTEDHSGSDKNGDNIGDRAGFSVIVLSSDTAQNSGLKTGIELGFWTDQIWAQEDGAALFTHAEGSSTFPTTTGLIAYDLEIVGSKYALYSGGNLILSGPLRDYTAATVPPGAPVNPYLIPNFIFLGDDTTSASATIQLSKVSVDTTPLVPSITTQPLASQTINSGQTANLSVTATGKSPLSYQWYQGNSGNTTNPVGGATNSSFTTPPLSTSTNYWVRVSNVINGVTYSVDSNTATVNVTTNPSPLVVTNPNDNGLGDTFGTLSYALTQVQASQTISFNLTSGNTVTVTNHLLPVVPDGVTIVGSCSSGQPGITIAAGPSLPAGDGLVLGKNITLNGIEVTHFKNSQIKAKPGHNNKFKCVVARK